MPAVQLTIYGRVQGVGYRAWLQREAQMLGLEGWVRNRCDGMVEALVVGSAEALTLIEAAAHHGPPASHVDRVVTESMPDRAGRGLSGIQIKPTL
jgi:acylphosphatase